MPQQEARGRLRVQSSSNSGQMMIPTSIHSSNTVESQRRATSPNADVARDTQELSAPIEGFVLSPLARLRSCIVFELSVPRALERRSLAQGRHE
jgi:hypothetical protein